MISRLPLKLPSISSRRNYLLMFFMWPPPENWRFLVYSFRIHVSVLASTGGYTYLNVKGTFVMSQCQFYWFWAITRLTFFWNFYYFVRSIFLYFFDGYTSWDIFSKSASIHHIFCWLVTHHRDFYFRFGQFINMYILNLRNFRFHWR